jgi:hypothetical protein
MAVRIKLRRGTKEDWEQYNPVLALGEIGLEYVIDPITNSITDWSLKVGDGVHTWLELDYPEVGIVSDCIIDGGVV